MIWSCKNFTRAGFSKLSRHDGRYIDIYVQWHMISTKHDSKIRYIECASTDGLDNYLFSDRKWPVLTLHCSIPVNGDCQLKTCNLYSDWIMEWEYLIT